MREARWKRENPEPENAPSAHPPQADPEPEDGPGLGHPPEADRSRLRRTGPPEADMSVRMMADALGKK
jgi:hypothetical protein